MRGRAPPPVIIPSGRAVHVVPCDRCGVSTPPTELDSVEGEYGVCIECARRIWGIDPDTLIVEAVEAVVP